MASRQWVRWNEDSRAAANRAKHLAENGGSFVHGKGGWMWIAPQAAPAPKPVIKPVTSTKTKED